MREEHQSLLHFFHHHPPTLSPLDDCPPPPLPPPLSTNPWPRLPRRHCHQPCHGTICGICASATPHTIHCACSSLSLHFFPNTSFLSVSDSRDFFCGLRSDGTTPFCWTPANVATTYNTCGAYGFAAYINLWLHLTHLNKAEDKEFGVPGFPDTFRLSRNQLSYFLRAVDGNDPWSIFVQEQLTLSLSSNGLLCNTVKELEVTGLRLLCKNTDLPVWPMVPSLYKSTGLVGDQTGKKAGISTEACIQWLDTYKSSAVLYVSFTLAEGLEGNGVAFLWVVYPPIGFVLKQEFREEWLPEGFKERARSNGR